MAKFKKHCPKTEPSTQFKVLVSDDYLLSENYKAFKEAAYQAYDADDQAFFDALSDDEVIVLYASCYLHEQYPATLAYDDEVSDAIFNRRNWKQLLTSANGLIFNNLSENQIQQAFSKHFPKCTETFSIQEKREKLIKKTTP